MFKNKEEILEQIVLFSVAHNVPMDQIALGGGGALVVMGIREQTADLNIWVDDPHFQRLADRQGVTVRAWHDVVVPPEDKSVIWTRKRNRYFPTIVTVGELNIFDPLSLTVQKRGSLIEPARPAEKRKQDHKDIVALNDILKEKNKVRELA